MQKIDRSGTNQTEITKNTKKSMSWNHEFTPTYTHPHTYMFEVVCMGYVPINHLLGRGNLKQNRRKGTRERA